VASLVLQEIENYSPEIIRKAQSNEILEIKKDAEAHSGIGDRR